MMLESGFGVFYLNNRGYGGSGGSPTEARNVADATAAYDELKGFGVRAKLSPMESRLARVRRCDSQRSSRSLVWC